ncbi:hypothetical protein DRQ36_07420, partial [bacterium]
MKNLLIILLLAISFAGAWEKTWNLVHKECFRDLVQLDDGGFILVGRSGWPTSARGEIIMMRVDVDGDTIWTRIYGGAEDDYATGIVAIDDTTFAVVGVMQSAHPDHYSYLYLSRINLDGDTLWTNVSGTYVSSDTLYFGKAVDIDMDNDIIVLGGSWPTLAKYTTDGTEIWARVFNEFYCTYSFAEDMKALSNREPYGYITAGIHSILTRHDILGDTIWLKYYGVPEEDHFYAVLEIENPAPGFPGGFLAVGYTKDAYCCTSLYFAVRTDLDGDTVWTRYYSHPVYEWTGLSHGRQIARDIVWAGNEPYQTKFAIIGETAFPESLGGKYAAWLVFISDTLRGDTLWTKTYYDSLLEHLPQAIFPCNDGGFAIAGYKEDPWPVDEWDLWLLRVDSLGNSTPSAISESPAQKPEEISIAVHPNPFNSSVSIFAPDGAEIEIFDINGRLVEEIPALRGESAKPSSTDVSGACRWTP